MAKLSRIPARSPGDRVTPHHRRLILAALLEICRKFERLGVSVPARQACNDVAEILLAALAREKLAGRRKK